MKRPSLRALTWLVVVLIAHGSIYPWQFHAPPSFAEAFAALMAQRSWWTSRGDVLENIVLFMPLGALWAWSHHGGRGARVHDWLLMIVGSMGFAYALQVIQIYVPTRSAALSDVLWNAVGQALGVVLGVVLHAPLRAAAAMRGMPRAGVALLGLWLVLELFPFVPTLDWQQVKDALKPLLLQPQWRTASALNAALGLVVLAQLLREVPRRGGWIAAAVVIAFLAKPFIVGQALSLPHAVGLVGGALLAPLVLRAPAHRAAPLVIALALVWFTLDELRPYDLAEHAAPFHWMPFAALLLGSIPANVLALCHDLFWLGAVMVLAADSGARAGPLAFGLGLWTLALEGVQTLLPGRVADVTIALLPLLWWLWLRTFAPPDRAGRRA